jgi:two-component system OmpR family sensor kinase
MLGAALLMIWAGAAWATAVLLRHGIEDVFDSSLQETAQRLLPLAVVDIVGREDQDIASQRLGAIRSHDELLTYVIRDDKGKILLRSHAADLSVFPSYNGPGFGRTATHRLYSEEALQGTVRITMAEPLAHRAQVVRNVQIGLGLPILLMIPAAFAAVVLAVRRSTRPLRAFREQLETRSEKDLGPVMSELPSELAPLAATLNALLRRLRAAFEAERNLAANIAHELRTPLAGAIAQAQRIRKETTEPRIEQRAVDIEETLKRLAVRAERLMQLARAEGSRLRLDQMSDLRATLRVLVDDLRRGMSQEERVVLRMPETPVMSDIDPDAVGILCRNLVENALRYGSDSSPVEVTLDPNGLLTVSNVGPVVPPEALAKLADRFERGGASARGSGIGLSIVSTIADRIGSSLALRSPRPGTQSGFEASVKLLIASESKATASS